VEDSFRVGFVLRKLEILFKKEEKMKKTILISLIVGITLMFGAWAMAAPKIAVPLSEPTNFSCTVDADSVYFDWDDVDGAYKYSVDVEVLLEEGPEGGWEDATTFKLSFGTSDRTDGAPINQSDLDVPAELFGYYYLDEFYNEVWFHLTGYTARAKVKALNPPGKSQNHPFSDWCDDFIIP